MDKETQRRLDSVLEDELRVGFRVKDVPEQIVKLLHANGGPAIKRVRFSRLNPSRRRKISESVQKQYHKDLRDPDILSHEQILKLVEERGEWTKAMDDEVAALRDKTSREMGELYANGMVNEEWGIELLEMTAGFRSQILPLFSDPEEYHKVGKIFDRWVEFNKDQQADYNERFAKLQDREQYSPDVDQQRILTAVAADPQAVEMVYAIDDLRDRLYRFVQLQRDRLRLANLQLKHVKIFSESVEQRRDNTEEMARLYFTTEVVDDSGSPLGPLASKFEELWEFPEDAVQWFLLEAYFFQNGIPDSAREYLETFGFLKADQAEETNPSPDGESAPSDGLPDPQTFSSATAVPEETVAASSVSDVATTSMTGS